MQYEWSSSSSLGWYSPGACDVQMDPRNSNAWLLESEWLPEVTQLTLVPLHTEHIGALHPRFGPVRPSVGSSSNPVNRRNASLVHHYDGVVSETSRRMLTVSAGPGTARSRVHTETAYPPLNKNSPADAFAGRHVRTQGILLARKYCIARRTCTNSGFPQGSCPNLPSERHV